jgi:hypothetical protein
MSYKIQLGFEEGFYVAYLVEHTEKLQQAKIIDEITNFEIDDLLEDIPEDWKIKLTNFLDN